MHDTGQHIVAVSQAFTDIIALAHKVAVSACCILITGESGTGKELIARTIHEASAFRSGRYVPINVASMPSDLVESQLFGHVRGAFTGATHDRLGAFRTASGGTLLLDEIGDLPVNTQPKLLRALEQHEVLPVGSDVTVPVETRVIAATSKDIGKLVELKRFRADLLYRLNVVQIKIPPLRERPEDIPVLAEYYCDKYAREMGKSVSGIQPKAIAKLIDSPWHGNVRELAHTIERAVLLCDSSEIGVRDLLETLGDVDNFAEQTLYHAVECFKRRHIIKIIEDVCGDRLEAAKLLGLSQATLFRYIHKFQLKGYGLHR